MQLSQLGLIRVGPVPTRLQRRAAQATWAIGISLTVIPLRQDSTKEEWASVLARADLLQQETNGENTYDPIKFLRHELGYEHLPAADRRTLERIETFSTPRRETAAAALAAKLERDAGFIGLGYPASPELISKRLGCLVHHPGAPGLDLAALCLKRSSS